MISVMLRPEEVPSLYGAEAEVNVGKKEVVLQVKTKDSDADGLWGRVQRDIAGNDIWCFRTGCRDAQGGRRTCMLLCHGAPGNEMLKKSDKGRYLNAPA